MHNQIKRVIKGGDRNNRPDRLAGSEGHTPGASDRKIHRYFTALKMTNAFDGQPHTIYRPLHLNPSIDQRLASLVRDQEGKFLETATHQRTGTSKDGNTSVGRQPIFPLAMENYGPIQPMICKSPVRAFDFVDCLETERILYRNFLAAHLEATCRCGLLDVADAPGSDLTGNSGWLIIFRRLSNNHTLN